MHPKQPRVVLVTIEYYPTLGGMQTHLRHLSGYLQRQGVPVAVVTRSTPDLAVRDRLDGVPIRRVRTRGGRAIASLGFVLKSLPVLLLQARSPETILHCHVLFSPTTAGLLANMASGMPLVLNPHRGGMLGDMDRLLKRASGRGRWQLMKQRADAFISISSEIRGELEQAGAPPSRIYDIPNAIDTRHARPASASERAALRSSLRFNGGPVVCYAARMVPEKNGDVLLDAWAQVVRRNPRAQLLFLGSGPEQARWEEQRTRLGLDGSVTFGGRVSDVTPYFQSADAFVLPSSTEGLPMALLEAQACGLPAVVTPVGANAEVVCDGENGLLVRVGDRDDLAEKLSALIDDGALRERMSRAARATVEDRYSVEQVGAATLRLYRQLLQERR